jgi:hypothetical protein
MSFREPLKTYRAILDIEFVTPRISQASDTLSPLSHLDCSQRNHWHGDDEARFSPYSASAARHLHQFCSSSANAPNPHHDRSGRPSNRLRKGKFERRRACYVLSTYRERLGAEHFRAVFPVTAQAGRRTGARVFCEIPSQGILKELVLICAVYGLPPRRRPGQGREGRSGLCDTGGASVYATWCPSERTVVYGV